MRTTTIHPVVKRAAVRLVQSGVSIPAASHLLDISDDTVRRALTLFEETGDVVPLPTGKKRGRPPILGQEDRKVSYLTPIQLRGIFDVSTSSILKAWSA